MQRFALVSRLQRIHGGAVVRVLAGPGFGKSTLAQSWGDIVHVRSAIISARPDAGWDFAHAAMQAIQAALPDIAREISTSEDEVVGLERMMGAVKDRFLLLIVDDVQNLAGEQNLAALRALTTDLPAGVTLALVGRNMPQGFSFGHVAEGLVALTQEDLAISGSDLATAFGTSLSPEVIAEVHRLSGGWPKALRYAIAHAAGNPSADEERRQLSAYLREEVIGELDPEVRALLEVAAVLKRADAQLLDEVRGRRDSAAIFDRLTEQPVPLVRVSDGQVSTHALFAATILQPRPGLASRRETSVREAAAEVFMRREDPQSAFSAMAAEGDREVLARFAYLSGRRLVYQGRTAIVRTWLASFSAAEVWRWPELQVLHALIEETEGHFAAVDEWVDVLDGEDLGPVIQQEVGEASTVGLLRRTLDRRPTDIAQGPAPRGWWGLERRLVDALDVLEAGDLERAEGIMRALAPFVRDEPAIEVWRATMLGYLYTVQGRTAAAQAVAEEAEAGWAGADAANRDLTVGLDAVLALALAQGSRTAAALRRFDAAIAKLSKRSVPGSKRVTLLELILVEAGMLLGRGHYAVQLAQGLADRVEPLRAPTFFERRARQMVIRYGGSVPGVDEGTPITTAELRVLQLLKDHQPVPTIADQLGRSPATVRTHLRNLYRKLGVHTRLEALRAAESLGLLLRGSQGADGVRSAHTLHPDQMA